jgi:hypothetical protein
MEPVCFEIDQVNSVLPADRWLPVRRGEHTIGRHPIANSQNRNAVASGREGSLSSKIIVAPSDPTLPRYGSDFPATNVKKRGVYS